MATGHFGGTVSIGAVTLTSSGGSRDVFLAKFDGSGSTVWAKRFGGPFDQVGTGVAVDSAGNIAVSGIYYEAMSFSDVSGTAVYYAHPGGYFSRFLARLDPAGNLLWDEGFLNATDWVLDDAQKWERGLAIDGAGNVLLTGTMTGSTDVGGGVLTSAWGDTLIARFAP